MWTINYTEMGSFLKKVLRILTLNFLTHDDCYPAIHSFPSRFWDLTESYCNTPIKRTEWHVVCGAQSIQKFKFLIMLNNPSTVFFKKFFFFLLKYDRHLSVSQSRQTCHSGPPKGLVNIIIQLRNYIKYETWSASSFYSIDRETLHSELTADMNLNSSAASLTFFFFFFPLFQNCTQPWNSPLDYFCDQTVGAYMQPCLRVQLK